MEGFVSEIEEREAATFVGYTWREWSMDLSYDDRVDGVAHYRLRKLIELHQADAQRREQERRDQAGRRKG